MRRVRRKKKFWGRFRQNIRKRLLSGLLVVIPLGITLFVLNFLYVFTAAPIASVVKNAVGEQPRMYVEVVSVTLLLTALYLVGLVTNFFIGRKLLNLAEALIRQIPVVKTVYGATKQVVDAVSMRDSAASYKSAVFVEFPNPGALSIAFVTGRIQGSDGCEYLKVFVPTTPNPTSGFFQLVKPEKVVQSNLSVEEAVKFLMSCGIVAPDVLDLNPVGSELADTKQADVDDDEYDWVEDEVEEEKAGPEAAAS